jgi:hypothetical protein
MTDTPLPLSVLWQCLSGRGWSVVHAFAQPTGVMLLVEGTFYAIDILVEWPSQQPLLCTTHCVNTPHACNAAALLVNCLQVPAVVKGEC